LACIVEDRGFEYGSSETKKLVVEVGGAFIVGILGCVVKEGLKRSGLVREWVFERGGEGVGKLVRWSEGK
jgi:hypothetical protein